MYKTRSHLAFLKRYNVIGWFFQRNLLTSTTTSAQDQLNVSLSAGALAASGEDAHTVATSLTSKNHAIHLKKSRTT